MEESKDKHKGNSRGPDSIVELSNRSSNGPKRGMVLPFQPLSLAFQNVNYYVDMPAVSKLHLIHLSLCWTSLIVLFKHCRR